MSVLALGTKKYSRVARQLLVTRNLLALLQHSRNYSNQPAQTTEGSQIPKTLYDILPEGQEVDPRAHFRWAPDEAIPTVLHRLSVQKPELWENIKNGQILMRGDFEEELKFFRKKHSPAIAFAAKISERIAREKFLNFRKHGLRREDLYPQYPDFVNAMQRLSHKELEKRDRRIKRAYAVTLLYNDLPESEWTTEEENSTVYLNPLLRQWINERKLRDNWRFPKWVLLLKSIVSPAKIIN